MPIVEYFCPQTHKIYSFYARTLSESSLIPKCPDGEANTMNRIMSSFAVTNRAKEPGENSPNMDDPKLEAAMAQMESEMATMDEENPDPRKMGQLMRKMAELTGEKMPEVMEEMIGRLEAGEDPEKLEEEFGDLSEMDEIGEGGGEDAFTASGRLKVKRRKAPTRDPNLYELKDYL